MKWKNKVEAARWLLKQDKGTKFRRVRGDSEDQVSITGQGAYPWGVAGVCIEFSDGSVIAIGHADNVLIDCEDGAIVYHDEDKVYLYPEETKMWKSIDQEILEAEAKVQSLKAKKKRRSWKHKDDYSIKEKVAAFDRFWDLAAEVMEEYDVDYCEDDHYACFEAVTELLKR